MTTAPDDEKDYSEEVVIVIRGRTRRDGNGPRYRSVASIIGELVKKEAPGLFEGEVVLQTILNVNDNTHTVPRTFIQQRFIFPSSQ